MTVYHAKDADTKEISEALSSARQKKTAMIGKDIDLLVLLLPHAGEYVKNMFVQSFR